MANAWDDFWANLTKPIAGGQGGYQAYGKWDSKQDPIPAMTMGGQSNTPLTQGQRIGMGNGSSRMQQAVNTDKLPGMTQDNSASQFAPRYANKQLSDEAAYQKQADDPMKKLLDRRSQLESMLDEDYTGDPEMDALIEQAYSSALSNITGARGRANENFTQSDKAIADLSAGHVNTIKTDDMDAVKRIGGELQSGYQQTYDTAKGSLEADRSSELEQRTAMLQRLGIQEAGLGDAGKGETEAIQRLTENQAEAVKQAQGYQAADEVRNTELAASQASAGVERRSALNKDLQGILGNLDSAESELNTSKAQQQIQARQAGMADFTRQKSAISDSIAGIDDRIDKKTNDDRDYALKLQEQAQKASSSGSGVYDAVRNSVSSRGIDPEPYIQAYNEVLATEGYNPSLNGDKNAFYAKKMKEKAAKKGIKLDDSTIGSVVMGIHNYGTDKLGN